MGPLFKFLNRDALRPLRFLAVGGTATALHLVIAGSILLFFKEVSPYLANLIAFLAAFLLSFFGHKHITFQTGGSLWKFFVIAVGGFILNNLILSALLAIPIQNIVAVSIATICVPVLTYTASSIWAFRKDVK